MNTVMWLLEMLGNVLFGVLLVCAVGAILFCSACLIVRTADFLLKVRGE